MNEFPFFQVVKKKTRTIGGSSGNNVGYNNKKSQNISSPSNAHTHNTAQNNNINSGYNLIELKCTKCQYTT